ncbi:MAG TPA: response regulator [Candidatus Saccharimonadales bacterium]|nr:response regulator [Candidatus Saccharimonadales bacterium]
MKKKILVADDDPAIVDAIQMILEDEGFDVETTVNGETVGKMNKRHPDLLLLDIWMSGQDGREIAKRLKHEKKTKNIPIILISATKDIEKSAKEAGADNFLAKPFEIQDLLKIVHRYV